MSAGKRAVVSILLCFASNLLTGQSTVDWSTTLGGSSWEQDPLVYALPEGGCLVVGNTYSNNGDLSGSMGNCDIVALRLDSEGNALWQERFGGENTDLVSDVIILPDGGAVICGRSQSSSGMMAGLHQGLFDLLVFRISEQGTLLWSSAFGGSNSDHANAICPHPDGGFVVAGKSNSSDGDTGGQIASHDIWLLHIDDDGNLIEQTSLGEEFGTSGFIAYEYANDLVMSDDQNLILVGWSNAVSVNFDEDGPYRDQYIAKLNPGLDIVWESYKGGMVADEVNVAWPMPNGGVMAAGITWSPDFAVSDLDNPDYCLGTLTKVNGVGDIEWAQVFGGEDIDRILDLCPGNQGGWFAIGLSESMTGPFSDNAGQADLWLLHLNGDGQLVYQELMGGSQNDIGNSMAMDQLSGRIYLAGTAYSADGDLSQNQGESDFWLLGLDVPSSVNNAKPDAPMRYDFAAGELIWVSEKTPSRDILVFNAIGQQVLQQPAGWSNLALNQLTSGYYVVVDYSKGQSSKLRVFVP